MSRSPKSSSESPTSPESGDADDGKEPKEDVAPPSLMPSPVMRVGGVKDLVGGALKLGKAAKDREPEQDEPRREGPIEIELEMSRQRAASMTAFGLIVGSLLIWKLGTVGVWVGVVLLVVGAFRAWELVQTFLYAPGTIKVTDSVVSLPRGLCLPKPVQVTPNDVTAVYFLRRSVPWNRSAPVLVVEIGDRAMAFPRDWFASEADQRHVVHALMRGLPGGAKSEVKEGDAPREKVMIGDDGKAAWGQMIGGVVLLGIGVVGTALSKTSASAGGQYAIYVGPMVAGVILMWRGFARW